MWCVKEGDVATPVLLLVGNSILNQLILGIGVSVNALNCGCGARQAEVHFSLNWGVTETSF